MPNIRDTLHSTRTHPNGPICVIPARRATQIFPQIFKHLCMYVLGWLLRSPFPSTVRSHLCHLATNPSLSLTHTIPAPSQKYKNTHTFWLVAPQSAMSQSVVCDRVWLVDYRNNKNTHKTADFPLSLSLAVARSIWFWCCCSVLVGCCLFFSVHQFTSFLHHFVFFSLGCSVLFYPKVAQKFRILRRSFGAVIRSNRAIRSVFFLFIITFISRSAR